MKGMGGVMTEFLETSEGRRLAYDRLAGTGPGVVFLGGFRSDKEGSKALALESWARRRAGHFCGSTIPGMGSRRANLPMDASGTGWPMRGRPWRR